MGIGVSELLIVLAIVALLFGTKKLRSVGTDLGSRHQELQESHRRERGGHRRTPERLRSRRRPGRETQRPALALCSTSGFGSYAWSGSWR